ncbi:M48 family metalloprotease [Chitinophaga sp. SYP-B3965]|uniref:M56 family metallopeptidase n=1 Tax=Chitinophaga sp. SYP-B3965 TaxID=2663120 RepID=UPI001299B591|nr:M56 family metallopeptidase [Chitinophaga sp. SYP-B3965]MRG45585.1 M48 family metalloprotease [Chitinophaga sp. SYP-B3965]
MNSLLPFTTDIIRAFGWTLLHSFWQAFFVYACLRIVLRIWPMASAAIKYHLSFLSLAGIAGWFLVTFYNQLNAIKEVQKIQEMAMTWDTATIAAAMEQLPKQSNGLQAMLPGMESYFPFLVAVYIIGVTLMTIKLCLDLAQLRQMRQEGISAMGVTWDEHLLKLAVSMGVTRKVQLFISQHLQVPVMIGFLKPVILLPAAMVSNLSPEQLETILLHELAHIKRNDYLLNIFQSIVETILFFNPFVWWISKNIRLEREHCCDDLVIAGTVQPLHYAKALVALEEYRLTANPMAMAAADDKHHLLHRIKRIMEMKTKNLNYSQRVLALLIIVVGLVSIAWLNPGNRSEKKEKKSTFIGMASDTIPVPPPTPAPLPAVKAVPAPATPPAVTPPSPVPAPDAPPTPAPAPAPAPSPAFQSLTPMAPMAPMAPPALSYYVSAMPPTPAPVSVYYAPYNAYFANIDTTTPRSRKIIVKGDDGVEKEYNSIAEMPEADRKKMEENYIRMQQQYADMQKQPQRMNFNYNSYNKDFKINKAEFEKAMKAAEEAVKKTDWSKMGKEIEASMKKINWDKMNKDVQESLKKMKLDNKMSEIQFNKLKDEIKIHFNKADWEKVNKQMQESLKKVDWEKIDKQMKESMEKMKMNFDSSRNFHYNRDGSYNRDEDHSREMEELQVTQKEAFREAYHAQADARRVTAEQRAEVARVHAEQRAQNDRIQTEQRAENARIQSEQRGQNNRIVAEQVARNKSIQSEQLAQNDRIRSEQRAENDRIRSEQRKVAGEIRQVASEKRAREAEARHKALNEMLDGMQKDNLLDREKDFEIEKKGDDLYINGKKQPDEVNKKYEQYLKNKNVTIKKSKDNFHMNTQDNR